jgi:hypothetical protein
MQKNPRKEIIPAKKRFFLARSLTKKNENPKNNVSKSVPLQE